MSGRRPASRLLPPRLDQAGTTLTELVVTVVVFAMIVGVIVALWQQSQEAYFRGATAAELTQNARVALEQMAREIRQAGYNPCRYIAGCGPGAFAPSVPGVLPIQAMTATSLWVRADRNANGTVTGGDPDENVCFYLAATVIRRKTTGVDCSSGGEELARNVAALTFTYLRADGTTTTVPAEVRVVRIALSAQETFMGAPVTVTLRSDVRLRDL